MLELCFWTVFFFWWFLPVWLKNEGDATNYTFPRQKLVLMIFLVFNKQDTFAWNLKCPLFFFIYFLLFCGVFLLHGQSELFLFLGIKFPFFRRGSRSLIGKGGNISGGDCMHSTAVHQSIHHYAQHGTHKSARDWLWLHERVAEVRRGGGRRRGGRAANGRLHGQKKRNHLGQKKGGGKRYITTHANRPRDISGEAQATEANHFLPKKPCQLSDGVIRNNMAKIV